MTKKAKTTKQFDIRRYSLRSGVIIIAFAALFALLLLRVNIFGEALRVLSDANMWLVLFGAGLLFMTFIFTAMSYRALSFHKLPFGRLVFIQVACGFAGKLLPAGTGSLAVNARFLNKYRHTALESTAIAGMNNIMGFVGHMSIFITALLLSGSSLDDLYKPTSQLPPSAWFLIAGMGLLVLFGLSLLPVIRSKLLGFSRGLAKFTAIYRKNPSKLLRSYIAALLITFSYLGILYASISALGLSAGGLQILTAFSVGIAAASVTPTPGGIGGAEAGLVASLSLTGMDTADALSVTLLFRLITYWLPIIPGFLAFQYSVRKSYI